MEQYLQAENENIRISNSPRRSPQITHVSPVRSVYPTQPIGMDSIHTRPDLGLRTADFFDDSSDDGSATAKDPGAVASDVDERRGSAGKKRCTASTIEPFASQCESKPEPAELDDQGYQPLKHADSYEDPMVDIASSSFNGSVDELLPNAHHSSPPQLSRLHASRIPSGRAPRSSAPIEPSENRRSSLPPTKVDPTLGAYAIAHEITLHALMRDEKALDRSLQPFALAPLQAGDRRSLVPPSLDPRSPRNRTFSTPPAIKKAVHVVPPPIDTTAPRRSLPEHIVRTPYPFTSETGRRKDLTQERTDSDDASTPTPHAESILTLSIRKSNPNSKNRITSLTIPASNDFTAVRSSGEGATETHFRALDFDDAEFFRQLRQCYRELSGLMRFLSARTLTRIGVSGPATRAADVGYGWRSPRILAYKGLSDTFSEEQIFQHFRKPALGRSRYAFVHWAHRLTAASPARTPRTDNDSAQSTDKDRDLLVRREHPEGLEFVVTWSVARIIFVLFMVLVISAAASLLWIFLGRNTVEGWRPNGGFRDAGDRVGTGLLIGIYLLILGLSGMTGWLGVSWLLM